MLAANFRFAVTFEESTDDLCFHLFAMIQTCTALCIQVTSLHKDEEFESISKIFNVTYQEICDETVLGED